MRADHPPAAFSFQLSACGFSRLFGFRISDFFRPSAFSFQPSAFKLRFPGSLRVFCYLLVFGLLVLPARADSGVLVGAGEEWRALALSVGRGGPPGNWPSPGFEDSGWPTTIPGAWFGPEYALSPALPPPRPGRTFARKTFQVENPADVRWLWLRVGKETRWRAWLNGVEVTPRQVRLPRATSDHSRRASSAKLPSIQYKPNHTERLAGPCRTLHPRLLAGECTGRGSESEGL